MDLRKSIIKNAAAGLACLAVLYPLFVWLKNSPYSLFPAFGLLAFSILWLHIISAVFEPWLRKNFNFDRFVEITSLIVLFSIILHPLLLFFAVNFNLKALFSSSSPYIWLGVIGWLLLITYDIGKALKRHNFFARNWNSILFISTIGFLIIALHSLGLGSDLQSGPLRFVWIFYGITGLIATIYVYIIRK